MENNQKLSINTQSENHRGSVSSTNSLEVPVTPTRSPKKVSFSDDLPEANTTISNTTATTPTSNSATQVYKTNNSNKTTSDIMNQNNHNYNNNTSNNSNNQINENINNPLDFMFTQATQYLDKLHGNHHHSNQHIPTQETIMESPKEISGSPNTNNKFKSSLNINLNSNSYDNDKTIIKSTTPAILHINTEPIENTKGLYSLNRSQSPFNISTPSTIPAYSSQSSNSSSVSVSPNEPPYKPELELN